MKLNEFPNLLYGISEKKDGTMRLIGDELNDTATILNRKEFFSKVGIEFNDTIVAKLIHGNNVENIDYKDRGKVISGTDSLITNKKNLFLTITVADCLPVYFFDFEREIIGLVHVGWRGVVLNIAKETVNKMQEIYGSVSKDIIVYIGPHIKKCHFEVKDDVVNNFSDYKDFIIKKDDLKFIDLSGIVKRQLERIGIKEENISISDECTYCKSDKYFSFRRDKPEKLEAMVAYIGMRDSKTIK